MASKTNLPSYLFGSSDVSDSSDGSVSSDSSDSCDNSDQKSFFHQKKLFFTRKLFSSKKNFVHQQLFSLNKNHQQIVFPKELLFTKNFHQRTVVTDFFLM